MLRLSVLKLKASQYGEIKTGRLLTWWADFCDVMKCACQLTHVSSERLSRGKQYYFMTSAVVQMAIRISILLYQFIIKAIATSSPITETMLCLFNGSPTYWFTFHLSTRHILNYFTVDRSTASSQFRFYFDNTLLKFKRMGPTMYKWVLYCGGTGI